jgi:hypothetical protein
VERDQQVTLLSREPLGDRHPVSENPKDRRPAKRGDAVSVPASRRRRAEDEKFHRQAYSTKITLC